MNIFTKKQQARQNIDDKSKMKAERNRNTLALTKLKVLLRSKERKNMLPNAEIGLAKNLHLTKGNLIETYLEPQVRFERNDPENIEERRTVKPTLILIIKHGVSPEKLDDVIEKLRR